MIKSVYVCVKQNRADILQALARLIKNEAAKKVPEYDTEVDVSVEYCEYSFKHCFSIYSLIELNKH